MKMNIPHIETVIRHAQRAAEQHEGPHSNPYDATEPLEIAQFKAWLAAYYARVHELSIEVVT